MIFLSPMFETLVTNETSFTYRLTFGILNVYIKKYTKSILDYHVEEKKFLYSIRDCIFWNDCNLFGVDNIGRF